MRVKIGNTIYDSNDEPIMLILETEDKDNIFNMSPECTKYCSYPEGMEESAVIDFMKT